MKSGSRWPRCKCGHVANSHIMLPGPLYVRAGAPGIGECHHKRKGKCYCSAYEPVEPRPPKPTVRRLLGPEDQAA